MEGTSMDDKLDEKLDKIKTVMSQIMTAQIDCVHQTMSNYESAIKALITWIDDIEVQQGGCHLELSLTHWRSII